MRIVKSFCKTYQGSALNPLMRGLQRPQTPNCVMDMTVIELEIFRILEKLPLSSMNKYPFFKKVKNIENIMPKNVINSHKKWFQFPINSYFFQSVNLTIFPKLGNSCGKYVSIYVV